MTLNMTEVLLAIAVVSLGTAVQASIGFGLAMISAPLLVLINREFVPGPLIAVALVLALWMTYQERVAIVFGNLRAALLGRVLGTPPAAVLMGTLSAASFDLLFGILVLLGVGISLVHANIQPTPRTVFFASAASGFMSTISSIGGPPMALVYQHSHGASLRANLSVLFVLGCSISLLALALIGEFGTGDLIYVVILLAGMGLGVLMSAPLKRAVDRRKARPFLLGLCCISACLVLGRALL